MTEVPQNILGARVNEAGEVVYFWREEVSKKWAVKEVGKPSLLRRILRWNFRDDRRREGLIIRPHESQPGRYRVIRERDNKCLCVISELRRATDHAVNHQLHTRGQSVSETSADEHQRKLRAVREAIERRKQRQRFIGQVESE